MEVAQGGKYPVHALRGIPEPAAWSVVFLLAIEAVTNRASTAGMGSRLTLGRTVH